MAEPVTEQPPPPAPDPNSTIPPSDFDSISIPPFDDHFYHSGSDQTPIGELMSDLGFPDGEFELTFDGMDDLYFPAENETFLIPVNTSAQSPSTSSCAASDRRFSVTTAVAASPSLPPSPLLRQNPSGQESLLASKVRSQNPIGQIPQWRRRRRRRRKEKWRINRHCFCGRRKQSFDFLEL